MPGSLPNAASSILEIVKDSIKGFEMSLVATRSLQQIYQAPGRESQLIYLLELSRKAFADIDYVWEVEYLQLNLVEILDEEPYYRSRQIRCLEALYGFFTETPRRFRARMLLCRPNDIIPSREDSHKQGLELMFGKARPSYHDIRRSELVIALLLMKNFWMITDSDLSHLLSTLLEDNRPEPTQVLKDVKTTWEPLARQKQEAIPGGKYQTTTLKLSTFPELPPALKPDYQPMLGWEPDGNRPVSAGKCDIWGCWDSTESSSWNLVVAAGSAPPVQEFQEFIHGLLVKPSPGSLAQSSTSPDNLHLFSHWYTVVGGIVIPQVYLERRRIREAVKTLENLRYKNTASPSRAGAHRALMLKHYLRYTQHMAETMKQEVGRCPSEWGVLETPDWVIAALDEYEILQQEAEQIQTMAVEVRQMIIEQYSLHQSQFVRILSVLATIYVPLNFISSFFGMNLTEINDSPLPLKFFFMSAFPLMAATVIIPLIALPVFRFLASKFTLQQNPYKRVWIIVSFVIYIVSDAMSTSSTSFKTTAASIAILVNVINLSCMVVMFSRNRKRILKVGYVSENPELVLFWLITLGCLIVSIFAQIWVELVPFILYFLIVCFRWMKSWRKKKVSDEIPG